jgi:hypothetical protein
VSKGEGALKLGNMSPTKTIPKVISTRKQAGKEEKEKEVLSDED